MLLHRTLFLIVSSCIILFSIPAFAAERVILKYRVFRESISVEALSTFANTGKISTVLPVDIAVGGKKSAAIRRYLTEPVKVNPLILDRILNSPVGNIILDQLSQVIHTKSRKADRQALRSALILSANKDGQITLLEVIQNYPTSEVEVDGDRLESAYKTLLRLQGSLQNLLNF
ncbi:MAG: alpha/beta hydrolase [Scytonematopsis contorta HA4267-MV1]|jgi:hypothetical protein|nr:alpha/beta hydrolase [Scytonematopsis contorta HA4267-MV1]